MEFVFIIILAALGLQVFLFFYIKRKKKDITKSDTLLDKYNIKSRGDLFKMINSHGIPEQDRLKLEDYYQKGTL